MSRRCGTGAFFTYAWPGSVASASDEVYFRVFYAPSALGNRRERGVRKKIDGPQDVVVYLNFPHNMLHILWISSALLCGHPHPIPGFTSVWPRMGS